MQINNEEQHQRVVYVGISKGELEEIIFRALSEKLNIPTNVLRKHGDVKIEPNMEGSPSYESGHKASFRATIPL